jgi:chemotaxis protein methyltransferase CheR
MPAIAELLDSAPVLHAREFEQIRDLAYRHFGIDLSDGKQTLVQARIGKLLREHGMKSFQQYFDYVSSDSSGEALSTMVDVLTTNHTSFFREAQHFKLLSQTIFPSLQQRSQIHIWSAACSSGEEPYSIALTLLERSRELAVSKVKIRATDISQRVLEVARKGIYPADKLKGISPELMQRYMLKGHNASANSFRFKNEVRSMIAFEHGNLMEPLDRDYRCSVLFCRNVMIYFDKSTQQSLVQRLAHNLEEGGYLFIGHSESLNSIPHELEYIAPATYRKPGGTRGDQKPAHRTSSKIGRA